MKNIDLTGNVAERFDAARQEAENQPKTDVSEDVKAVRSMTSEDPCDGGARILIDLAKLDQFATEYAQDKYLPVQTKAAVIAGVTWVCKNSCPGSLSGLLTNDLTGEFRQKMQKAMAEVMANDKTTKFVSQWEKKHGKKKPAKLPEGEDYGIDGLYAAVDILEITLGKVDGYQSGDGILEHQCAISAVKKLYEESNQKPAEWSEKDIKIIEALINTVKISRSSCEEEDEVSDRYDDELNWLKTLRDRVQPKQEWSEEDETTKNNIRHIIRQYDKISKRENQPCWFIGDCLLWMQNIKDRVQPRRKPSEEQIKVCKEVYADVLSAKGFDLGFINSELDRLEGQFRNFIYETEN